MALRARVARHEQAFGSRKRDEGESNGGQGRNRTSDTRIFSAVLYQLSYLALRGCKPKDGQKPEYNMRTAAPEPHHERSRCRGMEAGLGEPAIT